MQPSSQPSQTPTQTPFEKPGKFWRGNIHTHCTRSDGLLPVEEVCRRYAEAGYDFLAMTDHFLPNFDFPLTDTVPYRTSTFTTLIGAELHAMAMELGNPWHIVAVGLPTDFAPNGENETGPQLAQRAMDAGAFVIAAHPQWFCMTEQDMLALGDVHAIEIFNASCSDDNDTAESTYLLDQMLARGKRYFVGATDDAHFVPNTHDSMAGWMMVKSETLEPEALLAALKAGDYYATTGPNLYDVHLEGSKLVVRCSPATHIFALGIPSEYQSARGHGLTQAEFDLSNWRSPYVRITVRDDRQLKAWSNPIWLR
jgi:hypothetical protein